MMSFLAERMSPKRFIGLPLSVLMTTTTYFALLYAGTALNFFQDSRIVWFDVWLSETLSGLRSPPVVLFFSVATAFGYWGVVMAMALTVTCVLWLNGRQRYMAGLWIALAGNQITVNVLKIIFERSRPALAHYHEASFSFPSGHSASAAAFFGVVTLILIRERKFGTLAPMAGGFSAVLLVGASRLVLGEHYLSDVVNGYLVGGLWAWFGMWLAAQSGAVAAGPDLRPTPAWRLFASLAVLAGATVVIWMLSANYLSNQIIVLSFTAAP